LTKIHSQLVFLIKIRKFYNHPSFVFWYFLSTGSELLYTSSQNLNR